jgi:MFS family permease
MAPIMAIIVAIKRTRPGHCKFMRYLSVVAGLRAASRVGADRANRYAGARSSREMNNRSRVTEPSSTAVCVGPIELAPGVTRTNLYTFIAAALIGISVVVFINFLQPMVLSTRLHVSSGLQGRLVSSLSILQEVIALLFVPALGRLSDRIGRRPIMVAGLTMLGCGLVCYPLAYSIPSLVAARIVTAIGAAGFAATLATVAADFPAEKSRGRLLGTLLITQQLAILFVVARIGVALPRWLAALGFDPQAALRGSFYSVAGLSLAGGIAAWCGLGDIGRSAASTAVAATAGRPKSAGLWAHVAAHPRFALVLAIAFVVRGDFSVISSFLSLWAVSAARLHGESATVGLQAGGRLLSCITMSGLISAVLTGWLVDRYQRLSVLMVALGLAGTGHLLFLWVSDISDLSAMAVASLVGAGEMSLVIAGQALLGQESPAAARGAAVGIFGLCGSIGVLSINLAGGWLFDFVSNKGPFILIGCIDAVILLAAMLVGRRMRWCRGVAAND